MDSWTAHADGTAQNRAPGVYIRFGVRDRVAGFRTGRPVFIGRPHSGPVRESRRGVQIRRLSAWEDFALEVGTPPPEGSFLAAGGPRILRKRRGAVRRGDVFDRQVAGAL